MTAQEETEKSEIQISKDCSSYLKLLQSTPGTKLELFCRNDVMCSRETAGKYFRFSLKSDGSPSITMCAEQVEKEIDIVKYYNFLNKHWIDTPKGTLRSFLTCIFKINQKLHDSTGKVKLEFDKKPVKYSKKNTKINLNNYTYHDDFDDASFEFYFFLDYILRLNQKKIYKHFKNTDIYCYILEILSIFEQIAWPLHFYTKYLVIHNRIVNFEHIEAFNHLCETMNRLDSKNRIDELYNKLDIHEDFLENQDSQTKPADKDKLPPDAMTLANVIKKYWATRVTLQRAISKGEITSYRLPKNKKHLVSEKEIAARFPKKP